jgi:hypothetical protein
MGVVIGSLVFEAVDFILLILVNIKYRTMSGLKLKRPWFSLFFGLLAMFIVAGFSGIHSMSMPDGINQRVLVVTNETSPFVCVGNLHAAGLRGSVLGWTDGVFESWSSVYFGAA